MIIENLTNPNQEPVDGDRIRVIHANGAIEEYEYHLYVAPPDTNTYLYVTYPTLAAVNTQIDLIVSVKFADGSPAPVQSTYYVPVIRLADNKQAAFLAVDFTNGVANVNFTVTEPGVYIMDTGKIRPVPTSIVVDHPEIIVV
jgi:hypothetical protein